MGRKRQVEVGTRATASSCSSLGVVLSGFVHKKTELQSMISRRKKRQVAGGLAALPQSQPAHDHVLRRRPTGRGAERRRDNPARGKTVATVGKRWCPFHFHALGGHPAENM